MYSCSCWTPASGKTTLTKELSNKLGLPFFDIDEGWRERWGLRNKPSMSVCYAYNHNRARPYLDRECPTIIVATYSWTGYHDMLRTFAQETESPVRVFLLRSPVDVIRDRVALRQDDPTDLSDVRTPDRAEELYNRYQPIISDKDKNANLLVIEIDSTQPPEKNVGIIIDSLHNLRKN